MLYRQIAGLCCLFICCSVLAWSDKDQDGVPDKKDACPNTPSGAVVLANGCQRVSQQGDDQSSKAELNHSVFFEFGKHAVLASEYTAIERAYMMMEQVGFSTVTVVGYTDNVGNELFNVKLSIERAESVKAILVKQYAIKPDVIEVIGKGSDAPLSSNRTALDRKKNRRVEIKFK
ncbi:OmpA family protein [Shewanella donghaensis]|uniref:OmpA family protein n=1 Tax=Shewanella donghaensis TaxID=238836 RepID=UPI0011841A03|nr:OmpA family protein [Shewanella donghaensis]